MIEPDATIANLRAALATTQAALKEVERERDDTRALVEDYRNDGAMPRGGIKFNWWSVATLERRQRRKAETTLKEALSDNAVLEERVAAAERKGMERAREFVKRANERYLSTISSDPLERTAWQAGVVHDGFRLAELAVRDAIAALPPATTTDPGQPRIGATSGGNAGPGASEVRHG